MGIPGSHFLSFVVLNVLFLSIATADGGTDFINGADAKVIIGGIVDYGSRIGKEEQVAMEMAVEDVNTLCSNLPHIELLIKNSRGEPIQAALAGKSYHFIPLNF